MKEADLIRMGTAPGTTTTAAGIVVPEGFAMTPGGVAVQMRTRYCCRYCGAAHGNEKGCELHEAQCRDQCRAQWMMSALGGPAAVSKTPEEITEYVRQVVIEFEKRPRTTWTEPGDSRY